MLGVIGAKGKLALLLFARCRRWLPEPTWEAELALWQRICNDAKVVLTPGKDCHAAEPGFFRLCFAWMPPEALPEAVRRLERVLGGPPAA